MFGEKKRKNIFWGAVLIVGLLVFLYVVNYLFYSENGAVSRLSNWADVSKYQAVFLTNGQVYFGGVTDVNDQTLILEDIYYLKTSQSLQTAEDEEATTGDSFSLVKLGDEIHGPTDRMSINISQVLFVENLKDDSKVVEAIIAYEGI
jgi:hypothetical protein